MILLSRIYYLNLVYQIYSNSINNHNTQLFKSILILFDPYTNYYYFNDIDIGLLVFGSIYEILIILYNKILNYKKYIFKFIKYI